MPCLALDPMGAVGLLVIPLQSSSSAPPLLTLAGSYWKEDSKGLIPVSAQAVLESHKGYKTGTQAVWTSSGNGAGPVCLCS